ncbi:hypothetical protein [Solwaraspora sp. WMMA2065]|uniref:hypothetical protein n=1 Tax=Solwaraspora sp. WMMA2065 TaxID=3015166 RepID=UPI00259B7FA4|nr:hypothetical protein [Solwaraspora sp. WMMA2065]WJK33052.1 hypothetical protein O7610_20315 [Solwaraspora sp. WMMA2065]
MVTLIPSAETLTTGSAVGGTAGLRGRQGAVGAIFRPFGDRGPPATPVRLVGVALVFVHGIGNRDGRAYANKVALRDALFQRFLLARGVPELAGSEIRNPLWGELGTAVGWSPATLPIDRNSERLGGDDPVVADLVAVADPGGSGMPLVQAARIDLHGAVDLLYSLLDLRGRDDAEIEELADQAVALADWCEHPDLDATTVDDDRELVELLVRRTAPVAVPAPGVEALGARRRMRVAAHAALIAAVDRYRRSNVGPPVRHAAAALRRLIGRPVSLLIGDVLVYLASRGSPERPGEVVSLVVRDLEEASREGPLIVVAHSMGGNIVYDVLSYFRPDLEVDTLVTVGTQVGFFEELGMFPARAGRPANVRRWINVVDRGDLLSYTAAPVLDGVIDYEFPTDALWAHGAYFRQPTFHARLAARVREARS